MNADTAQIEDVNSSLIAMLGYSHDELVGRNLCEIDAFADNVECRELIDDLRTKGNTRYDAIPLKTKAGVCIYVELVCDTYDCEDIKVIQCNVHDISEHTAAQIKSRRDSQLYAALSQCNKAIVQSVLVRLSH